MGGYLTKLNKRTGLLELLHITVNQLHGQWTNFAHVHMLLYALYYDTISLTSLRITQAFHKLLGIAENQIVCCDFKISNSIQITKDLDNGDSDNQSSTVLSLNSNKHKHTLTALTGLAFLIDLSWAVTYELTESYCTRLQSK